jgi:SAM-dependent methyltransferase
MTQGHLMLYALHVLELQRKLLGDRVRNSAFSAALQHAIVRNKSIVLDIGSGTGFLSFLAEQLGAKECWLVENGDVAELSERLAIANNMKRCRFVYGHSNDVPLPKADVIVSETLGNYALEEGIIGTMNGAHEYLKKGGHIIPRSIRQFVCPVISPRLQKSIDVWDVGYDLNFDAARSISLQNMYVKTLKKSDVLDHGKEAKAWDDIDFGMKNDDRRSATVEWTMRGTTTIHGLGLWWESVLAPGVTLSTSPLAKPTHWEQIYLPLLQPIRCQRSSIFRLTLESDTHPDVRMRLRWTAEKIVSGHTEEAQCLDTQEGLF